jgi:hypothetical protein
VVVDGVVMLAGGLAVMMRRPEVRWVGCAALPESCLAGMQPAAVALERPARPSAEAEPEAEAAPVG